MSNEIKSENTVDLYVTPIMPIVLDKNFSPAEKFDAIRQSMESYAASRISELEAENKHLREKADKWDALAAKMEKFYAEGSTADLVDVGEAASEAFGYDFY